MKASSRIDGSICGAILLRRPCLSDSSWTAAGAAAAAAKATVTYQRLPTKSQPQKSLVAPWLTGNNCHVSGSERLNGASNIGYSKRLRLLSSLHRPRPPRSPRLRPRLPCPSPLAASPLLGRIGRHDDGGFFRPSLITSTSLPPSCQNHTAAASGATAAPTTSRDEADTGEPEPEPEPAPKPRTKEELLALVDDGGDGDTETAEEHFRFFRDRYRSGYAQPDGPDVTVSNRADEADYPSHEQVMQANEEEKLVLWKLRFAIVSRLRRPDSTDLDTIYALYQQVPEPRMSYIHARLRHQLLRVLGSPEKKDSKSMLRYFAVVADVKNGGLHLTTGEWNAAISFASRYVGTSTEAELESALNLWQEMEQGAGIRGTDVTFNILFDVASKAGNFALAEMIYQEMEARGHRYNRYHYVSLIHFFGLKLDTAGVRAAYREMVQAGEIIDTVALNCVVAGFLRAGEEDAAERVYERMRALDHRATDIPPRDYTTNKAITQVLLMFARLARRHPPLRPNFQGAASLRPDLHTYRILINHYAVKVGDLAKVARYLDEMKFFRIPLHGAVFLALFKGFAAYGGSYGFRSYSPFSSSSSSSSSPRSTNTTNTTEGPTQRMKMHDMQGTQGSANANANAPPLPWSPQRLGSVWAAFLQAVDSGAVGLEIRPWLAVWALRAFARCGGREHVIEAYEALHERWHLDRAERQLVAEELAALMSRYD